MSKRLSLSLVSLSALGAMAFPASAQVNTETIHLKCSKGERSWAVTLYDQSQAKAPLVVYKSDGGKMLDFDRYRTDAEKFFAIESLAIGNSQVSHMVEISRTTGEMVVSTEEIMNGKKKPKSDLLKATCEKSEEPPVKTKF